MEKETEESKTPLSRHYFYRKATQPDQPSFNTVFLKGLDSSGDFEDRVSKFINKQSLRSSINQVQKEAAHDLSRRRAERKARKEREKIASGNLYSSEKPAETKLSETVPRKDKQLFQKSIILSAAEKNAWLANIHDDAMLMNPHQWLKLANLFNVNSKAVRQQTFLDFSSSEDVLKDRSVEGDDLKPLENYMELRDIQNRNYARDAVAEGIKFTKQNRVKEAMEFYKRSLEMDPKYPEGWFHLAESLVQQRKLTEAAEHLERVLKLDSSHEGAIALLASIQRTTQPKKQESEWDLVDEHGESMSKKVETKQRNHHEVEKEKVEKEEDEEESRRRKKRRSHSREKSRRSRSPDRKRRRRDESVQSTRRSRRYRDESADSRKREGSHRREDSSKKEVSKRRDESRNNRHRNSSNRHDERHKRERRSRSPTERTKRDHRSRSPAERRRRRRRSSSPKRRDAPPRAVD
ncbi:hypothetical protein A0J61_01644 [Choanephora cucurbitarum]|uniref:Uncharacterized protein n=1 Tax=Choanephora cucurbitarum TaxID=101091 RepID=A0A1C7NSF0_9FUNG|nr:hypothetical protein A0J61_01644 [Choanephora cucurbitarum]